MHSHKHVFSFVADQTIAEKYPSEAMAVRDGICDVVQVAGLTPVLKNINRKESTNLSKLIERHKNTDGQIDVGNLADKLIDSNYSSPDNPRYLLISDEINVYTRNDLGSYIVREEGLAIQSLNRFLGSWMMKKLEVYRHIGRHSYAHLLGINGSASQSPDHRRGRTSLSHCENECTMQRMSSTKETTELAESLRNRKLAGFCLSCVDTLREKQS